MFRRIIGLTTRLGVKGQSDIENCYRRGWTPNPKLVRNLYSGQRRVVVRGR